MKLYEQGYNEKNVRALENKSAKCEQKKREKIWTRMKRALVISAKEVFGHDKVGSKNVYNFWYKDEVK